MLTGLQMMKTICQDRRQPNDTSGRSARGISSVSADLDNLLRPKSLSELEKLEKQINAKLSSNQPIDTDYWEHLLQSLLLYKAKAKLKAISRTISRSRYTILRKQQLLEASALRSRLEPSASASSARSEPTTTIKDNEAGYDPAPMLRVSLQDKALPIIDDAKLQAELVSQCRLANMYDDH